MPSCCCLSIDFDGAECATATTTHPHIIRQARSLLVQSTFDRQGNPFQWHCSCYWLAAAALSWLVARRRLLFVFACVAVCANEVNKLTVTCMSPTAWWHRLWTFGRILRCRRAARPHIIKHACMESIQPFSWLFNASEVYTRKYMSVGSYL